MKTNGLTIANPLLMVESMATLELTYIEIYLQQFGYTRQQLRELPAVLARRLMTEAARYASGRLAEIEACARYMQDLQVNIGW